MYNYSELHNKTNFHLHALTGVKGNYGIFIAENDMYICRFLVWNLIFTCIWMGMIIIDIKGQSQSTFTEI